MTAAKIALDTALAVLLTVGGTSPDYISAHKRLDDFDTDDLMMLDVFLGQSSGIVWTSHVLTETSNWLAHFRGGRREETYLVLGELMKRWPEVSVASVDAAGRAEFTRLGLTDCALLQLASQGAVIVTTDGNLQTEALAAGLSCRHFAEIREEMRSILN